MNFQPISPETLRPRAQRSQMSLVQVCERAKRRLPMSTPRGKGQSPKLTTTGIQTHNLLACTDMPCFAVQL